MGRRRGAPRALIYQFSGSAVNPAARAPRRGRCAGRSPRARRLRPGRGAPARMRWRESRSTSPARAAIGIGALLVSLSPEPRDTRLRVQDRLDVALGDRVAGDPDVGVLHAARRRVRQTGLNAAAGARPRGRVGRCLARGAVFDHQPRHGPVVDGLEQAVGVGRHHDLLVPAARRRAAHGRRAVVRRGTGSSRDRRRSRARGRAGCRRRR